MRVGQAGAIAALLFVLATGSATAQDPPQPREIDGRLMTDGDQPDDYGLCLMEEVCAMDEGAIDLLAVDVREAWDQSTGLPALFLRLHYDGGNPVEGKQRIVFVMESPAGAFALEAYSKNLNDWHGDFDGIRGPYPYYEDGPKSLDFMLLYQTLGVGPGDSLSGLRVMSFVGDKRGDVMPGSWHYMDLRMASLNDEGAESITYTLQGPADLIDAYASQPALIVPYDGSKAYMSLSVENRLGETAQFAFLQLQFPNQLDVSVQPKGLKVLPGATERFVFTTAGASPGALVDLVGPEIRVTVYSDLGGLETFSLPILREAETPAGPVDPGALSLGEEPSGSSVPNVGAMVALTLLVGAAWLGRRRAA